MRRPSLTMSPSGQLLLVCEITLGCPCGGQFLELPELLRHAKHLTTSGDVGTVGRGACGAGA